MNFFQKLAEKSWILGLACMVAYVVATLVLLNEIRQAGNSGRTGDAIAVAAFLFLSFDIMFSKSKSEK